jgi:heme iron utilization protein
MTNVTNPTSGETAAEARALVTGAASAALATLDRRTGGPYVSLVNVAAAVDNAPLMLLSALAQHTQNILADSRASLLFTAPESDADPLTLGRVTLMGRVSRAPDDTARASYLAVHPAASQYANFGDFSFYRLDIQSAHFIGGFGRIVALTASDLMKL